MAKNMNFYDAMHEVLETSRYDFLTGRRVDIREAFWDFIERILSWIFGNLSFNLPDGEGGAVGLIVAVFTIIALILVVIAAWVLVRNMRRREVVRHSLSDIFEELKSHTVAELLQLADTAENRRITIRYKYIAVILSLNENDIITIEPSHTNAIILRQIKTTAPALAESFAYVMEAFHLTWFGHKNLADEAFAEFNAAVNRAVQVRQP